MIDYEVTFEDLSRYRGQARDILKALSIGRRWIPVAELEAISNSTRVAARIDTLRNRWNIDMRRDPNGGHRGEYRLIGKLEGDRVLQPHCNTCTCRG